MLRSIYPLENECPTLIRFSLEVVDCLCHLEMHRIKAVCLGVEEELVGNYESVEMLKRSVLQKFKKYLIQVNVKTTEVPFILTYTDEENQREEELQDISTITKSRQPWFLLNVKRIWDTCCVCLGPFGITEYQLPYECSTKQCGFQYCIKCVKSIKACNSQNQFYCLHCRAPTVTDGNLNQMLINLLWQSYSRKYGVDLVGHAQNIPGELFNDICNRIIHVQSLLERLNQVSLGNATSPESVRKLKQRANTFMERLKNIKRSVDTTALMDNDAQLHGSFTTYKKELDGSRSGARKCENFIEICELLLYYIREIEVNNTFPTLNQKLHEWENILLSNSEFQPKALDAFRALSEDLCRANIPSIPCRVGLIGETNSGKTTLGLSLREIHDDYSINFQSRELPNEILSSLVGVLQTTFCALEFEHEYAVGKKIIFVDIQGSTDSEREMKSGNYFDEIQKADCDLYIIVFEHQFTDTHRKWKEYITNNLCRTCWIVRSKMDKLFTETFKQNVGEDFYSCNYNRRTQYATRIAERLRAVSILDDNHKELEHIYLTGVPNEKDDNNDGGLLSQYVKFDLEDLIERIKQLPLYYRRARLQRSAIYAMARVINICFRRGYTLKVIKYSVLACVTAVVPFLDLVPRYFARDRIRDNFGVNKHSEIVKWWTDKTDEFLDYLKEFDLSSVTQDLQTSAFKSAGSSNSMLNEQTARHSSSFVTKTATGVGIAGVSVSDDVLRAIGTGATAAARVASIVFIVLGSALTAGICVWSALSNRNQMYDYLQRLCDDLIIISKPIAAAIILKNENRS